MQYRPSAAACKHRVQWLEGTCFRNKLCQDRYIACLNQYKLTARPSARQPRFQTLAIEGHGQATCIRAAVACTPHCSSQCQQPAGHHCSACWHGRTTESHQLRLRCSGCCSQTKPIMSPPGCMQMHAVHQQGPYLGLRGLAAGLGAGLVLVPCAHALVCSA